MNNFLFYCCWILIVSLHYSAYAVLTQQNNIHKTFGWALALFLLGAFGQYWIIISRYSTNLLMDGFIYDLAMLIPYVTTLIYLGEAKSFIPIQWIGLFMVLLGLIFLKIEG